MRMIRLFGFFVKKGIRTGKIRHLSIIMLYTLLYFFIFILLLSSFSMYKSASRTYDENLSNQDIGINYYRGNYNTSTKTFFDLKNCIKELDENVAKVYARYRYFELYDFDYLNMTILEGTLSDKDENPNGVFLSIDYKDEYAIGDFYTEENIQYKVLGFFEGEKSVVANLEYVLSMKKYNIMNITFFVNYEKMEMKNIKKLLSVYDVMVKHVNEPERISCDELGVIKGTDKITNIYSTLSTILMIVFSIYSIITILNVSNINDKAEGTYYAIMRLNGLTKKNVYSFVFVKDVILNFVASVLAVILFYCSFGLMKKFLSKFIFVIFSRCVDNFSFDISYQYYDNILIFVIPIVLNIGIIFVKTLITSKSKKAYDYLGGLEDYAR